MEGLDALIQRLLEGRVNRGKRIPLIETEVRQLCITAKEVFLRQPNLLELAAPINVCGFAGNTEFEQLVSIFSVLGTPSVEDWDELESIPDWHIMPQFQPQILDTLFPAQQALDLLLYTSRELMLSINCATRISAEDCLDHPFFNLLVQPKKQRSILFLTQPVL